MVVPASWAWDAECTAQTLAAIDRTARGARDDHARLGALPNHHFFPRDTPAMRDCIEIRGPSKLNLGLSVGGVVDGMHPISGWMITVDLFDDLEITRLPAGDPSRYAVIWHEEARRRTDIDWSISKDLTLLAHQALEAAVDRRLPIQSKLEKRIPVGGGLGGGSADAAAMLHGLNRLFNLDLSDDRLAEIAAPLGSDIPFLVHGGSAMVGGFGDEIESVPTPRDLHAILVLPDVSCPTGPVYGGFDRLNPEASVDPDRIRTIAAETVDPQAIFNDLADAAFELHPDLAAARDAVAAVVERPVHLSGSGSTLFVLIDDGFQADLLAGAIEERAGLPAVVARPTSGVTFVPQTMTD